MLHVFSEPSCTQSHIFAVYYGISVFFMCAYSQQTYFHVIQFETGIRTVEINNITIYCMFSELCVYNHAVIFSFLMYIFSCHYMREHIVIMHYIF
jgi:hypothetical protein